MRSIRFGLSAGLIAAFVGCGGPQEPAPPKVEKPATGTTAVEPAATGAKLTSTAAADAATGEAKPIPTTAASTPATAPASTPATSATTSAAPAPADSGKQAAAGAILPFLAPDFIAAIHVRPSKVLGASIVKKWLSMIPRPEEPKGGESEDIGRRIEYENAQLTTKTLERLGGLEEAWIYIDPNPMGKSPIGFAAVLRSQAPLAAKEFCGEWLPLAVEWTEAEVEGKKFLVAQGVEGELGSPFAIHQADDRTLLIGPEDVLLRVLTSKPGPSPLADAASKQKYEGSFTAVAVPGPFKPLLEQAKGTLSEIELVAPYSKLPEALPHLESAVLKLSLEGPELLALDLALDDEAAGAKLKETLDEVWTEGKVLLGLAAQQAKAQVGAKAEGLLKELRGKVALAQEGSVTSIKLGLPAGLEAAVDETVSVAIPKIRTAAKRAQRLNNLKQIVIAMHNDLATTNKLPTDYVSADGKPLLSWRVRILPYIEEKPLFDQFRLDEPWDSPNNKPLAAKMPRLFEVPGAKPGTTSIYFFKGPGTAFPKAGEALGLEGIADGTSNTLAIVPAKPEKAVPWTQPSDLAFDAEKLQELVDALPEMEVLAAFYDGHVEVFKERPTAERLKALVTAGGGEVIEEEPEAK